MASGQLTTLIRHLHHVLRPRASDGLTDAQLLDRFVQGRDEAAFELLVWRHGAMVLNVCLRVLHRSHDAEDAFQATFLALARKAAAIGNGTSVGSWLYKVAYRVALRARASVLVRPLPEEPLRDPSAREPLADLLRREVRSVLDEEVNRLSDRYRVAFVLCHLEGQTIEAAARILGCPPGTVGTRLARARDLLRRRLVRRGIGLSALVVTWNAAGSVPAALVEATTKAALFGTANQAAAAGAISAHVAALTKGALQTMFVTRWTITTAAVLALGLLGGAAFRAHQAQAVEPVLQQPVQVAFCRPARNDVPTAVLKWKFEKGKTFYLIMTTTTEQTMKVVNNDVKQTQKQTFYYSLTPVRQDGDIWTIKQKIEGVVMNIDIGNQKITYDSTAPGAPQNPLGDFFKALVGAEFTVTLDTRRMKVTRIDGRDEFLKKLVAANPQMKALLDATLSDNALKEMAEPTFAAVPQKEVEVGEKWKRDSTLDMGPIGKYDNRYTYTFEGREGKLDKIKVETVLKYKGPGEAAGAGAGGLPFKIKSANLKSSNATGTILFDPHKGRVVRLEISVSLDGKMEIDIGGQVTEVTLSQTQQMSVKTKDTNPLKPTQPQDEPKRKP